MSKVVDERVVEMKFDNRNFERNVSTTMSTLDKLKAKLNLSGAAKGLSNLTGHANIVRKNMDVLGQGVHSVQAEFSGLSVIGATCLVNLTNSAIRAGKNIVSALTIDPVKTGFSEYETKINAIQTILANTSSKGENIDSVTKVIDELNTYADKTIYNFSEMTRNIGTFTAAGVGLKESAAAIQGIANVAAMSGSSSQQASTAMYQLSQALAAGTVKLMDWNSVVNAGMGGEKLQEALKQTAREFGVNVDAIIKDAGSFRDSLQEGWITADVLNTTLRKFTVEGAKEYADSMVKAGKYTQEQADALMKEAQMAEDAATKVKTLTQLYDTLKETAQSGWGKTWELIFGDFEEAKSFFTDLNDKLSPIIDKMSDSRNNLIEGALSSKWDQFSKHVEDAGGSMDKFKESLAAVVKENHDWDLNSMVEEFGSFEKVISSGKISTDDLIGAFKRLGGESSELNKSTQNMTEKLEYFQNVVDRVWGGEFGVGEQRMKALTDAGYEYSQVQDLVNKTVDGHRLTLEDLTDEQLKNIGCTNEEIEAFRKLANEAERTGTPLNELIKNIQKPSGRELLFDSLMNSINGVIKVCSTLKEAWREVFPPMSSDGLYGALEAINSFSKKLVMSDETADKLKRTFKGLFAILDVVTTILGSGFKIAFEVLKAVLSLFNMDILDLTAYIGDAAVRFRDWMDSVIDVKGAISFLLPYIEKSIDRTKKWFGVLKNSDAISKLFSGDFSGFIKSAKNAFKTVFSKDFFSLENGKKIAKNLFNGLQNGVDTYFPEFADKIKSSFKKLVDTIKNLDYGTIIAGLMTGGLLFTINNVAKALTSITKTIAKVLEKFAAPFEAVGKLIEAKAFDRKASGVLKIAVALGVLAGAVYILGKLDRDALIQGGIAIGVLTVVLVGLMIAAKKLGAVSVGSEIATNALLKVAGSLLIIAASLKLISTMDEGGLKNAVIGLTATVIALLALMLIMNKLTLKGRAMMGAGSMLLKMSFAMIIMTYVIKLAADLDRSEVKRGIAVVAAIEVLFMAIVAVSKFAGKHGKAAGSLLLKMSIAMGIMVFVVKRAASIQKSEIKKAMDTLSRVAVLFGAIIVVSKFAGANGKKAGSMLIKMALAMGVLVLVVKSIAKMKPEDIDKGIEFIKKTMTMFALLTASSLLTGKNAAKAGIMLIGMAVAMGILTACIFAMSILKPEDVKAATDAISQIMLMMSIVVASTGLSKTATGTMIAMAIAIGIICGTLITLSFINTKKLTSATKALTVVMLSLAAVFASTKGLEKVKIGKVLLTFAGMALVMTAVANILVKMSNMNTQNALSNAAALSLTILALSGVMNVLSKSRNMNWKKLGQMGAGMAGLVAVLEGLVLVLASMNALGVDADAGNVAAICALLGAMTLVMIALSKFAGSPGWNTLGQLGAGMGGLVVVLEGLTLVLATMTALDVQNGVENAKALSVLLGAMTLAMVALSKFTKSTKWKTIGTASVGMAALAVVLEGLALVLATMSKLDVQNGVENAKALSILLGAMALAMIPMGLIGKLGPKILIGAGMLALMTIVTGVLALILGDMEGLNLKNGVENAKALGILINALAIAAVPLGLIGKLGRGILLGAVMLGALAGVIGLAIAAFQEWIAPGLPEMAENLSDFMTNLQPFIDGAQNVNSEAVDGCKNIADMLLALAEASIIDKLASLFGGDNWTDSTGDTLNQFGEAMVAFSNKLVQGNFNADAVNAAANAGSMIAKLYETLPRSGGAVGDIIKSVIGEKSMESFAADMVSFGDAMSQFSSSVSGIDSTAVESAANAGMMLAKMADTIPNSGGFLADLVGDNTMDEFGAELISFGKSMVAFSSIITEGNIDSDAVEAAANAGTMLADMADTLPNSGGFLAALVGDNTMDEFGADLVSFGKAIVGFSKIITEGGIDSDAVETAANAGIMLAKMADNVPNSGGFISWIVGNNDLDDFGEQLAIFGAGLAGFADKVKNVKTDNITAAAEAGKVLADMAASIPNDGGLISWFVDGYDMFKFGNNLGAFGLGLKELSDKTDGLIVGNIYHAATAAITLKNIINELPEEDCLEDKITAEDLSEISNLATALAKTLQSFSTNVAGVNIAQIEAAGAEIVKIVKLLTAIGNTDFGDMSGFTTAMQDLGKVSVAKFIDAFGDGTSKASAKAKNMLDRMVSAMKSQSLKFSNAAKHLMSKFANGISTSSGKIIVAMSQVVTNMTFAIKIGYWSMYSAGSYLVQGLASGISASTYLATAAATTAMQSAIKAAKEAAGINSPSKVFYEMGEFTVAGFVNALDDLNGKVYDSGYGMADNARKGFSKAISRITGSFDENSLQPTIRPVLDLSSVESGAGAINGIFNRNPSIGLLTNVNAVSRMMTNRQNGAGNADVVYAIDKLRKELGNNAGTTNNYINGISSNNDSSVNDAIETLVRAARVERRT